MAHDSDLITDAAKALTSPALDRLCNEAEAQSTTKDIAGDDRESQDPSGLAKWEGEGGATQGPATLPQHHP
jgi:hypothetical protein